MKNPFLWSMSFVLASIASAFLSITPQKNSSIMQLETGSFPQIGLAAAPVEITLFQEFSCPHCKVFHDEIFGWIQDNYIKTGKAKCTLIPTAFLDSSEEAFSCAIAALDQGPEHLANFLSFFFKGDLEKNLQKSQRELISGYFQYASHFSISRALRFLKKQDMTEVREKNIAAAEKLYKDAIHLPTILVNGKKMKHLDKNYLENMIEREYGRSFR